MPRFDQTYTYKACQIRVFKGDETDMNWTQEIKITLASEGKEGSIILTPLWNLEGAEDYDIKEYKSKFNEGDYFQQTFITKPKRKGIGSIMHDFLLEHKDDFLVQNVFSTYEPEDGHGISTDAQAFWVKRQVLEKAIYISELNRFRLNENEINNTIDEIP